MIEPIEYNIILKKNGKIATDQSLVFGYVGNRGIYKINVELQDEWVDTTVRAVWHIPTRKPTTVSTLVADGSLDVPTIATTTRGIGVIVFEGVLGEQVVTSANIRYSVKENCGIDSDGDIEVDGDIWQQYVSELKSYVDELKEYIDTLSFDSYATKEEFNELSDKVADNIANINVINNALKTMATQEYVTTVISSVIDTQDKKNDELSTSIKNNTDKIAELESNIANIEKDVDSVESSVENVKSTIDSIELDVSNIKSDVNSIELDISNVKSELNNKADKTSVTELSNNITNNSTKITELENGIILKADNSTVTELSNKVSSNTTQITSLETDIKLKADTSTVVELSDKVLNLESIASNIVLADSNTGISYSGVIKIINGKPVFEYDEVTESEDDKNE